MLWFHWVSGIPPLLPQLQCYHPFDLSYLFSISNTFQTCTAVQSGVGWEQRQWPIAIPAPRTACFHRGMRNAPLTPEGAHAKALRRRREEAVGPDVQRIWRGRSFCTHTHNAAAMCAFTLVHFCVRTRAPTHRAAHVRWYRGSGVAPPKGGKKGDGYQRALRGRSRAALNPLTMNYACWSITWRQTTKSSQPARKDGFHFTKWGRGRKEWKGRNAEGEECGEGNKEFSSGYFRFLHKWAWMDDMAC